MVRQWILIIAVLAGMAVVTPPTDARAARLVDDNDTVVLRGNVHPLARPEYHVGATDFSLPMERMILSLKLPPAKQAALDRLIAEQHDPTSPNYHRWLSPEEFGRQFGPAPDDIDALTGWLTSHGFTIDEVPKSRTWINFSGTVADVERAFRTKMHDYNVNGQLRHANASDPAIPRGLADLVSGVVSLHNFPRRSMSSGLRQMAPLETNPDYTSGSDHFMTPGDFATIYNVNPLYAAGIDGTGVTIAIVGRCNIHLSDVQTFRQRYGLPARNPVIVLNGTDPGVYDTGEEGEAILDVEWTGAVAKNATIKFVASKSTNTSDGVDLSAQYIVNNNLAPVMSTSFGLCEAAMGSANIFYNNLWQQAAAQGITSFVSTGDSGASGCNGGNASSGSGLGVNGLASTPYNVAVGGTQFAEGTGSYWNTSNASDGSSAKSYIPEAAWNESGAAGTGCPAGETCSQLWSTGGGASTLYTKPSWQVSPGVPAANNRYIPDVSLTAAIHDGYTVFQQDQYPNANYFGICGGTSASTQAFAGLMALIVQSTGQRQGNANTRFYQLANAQYGSGGAAVFHDITTGNNSVPRVTGYSSAVGYDLSTGLGSVDAYALVTNWSNTQSQSATVPGAPTIGIATAGVRQATVSFTPPASTGGSPITLYTVTSRPGGIKATGAHSPITVTGLANGTAYTFTVTATNSVGPGAPSSASNSVMPFTPIVINSGALYTGKTAVTLTLTCPGATAMQFSTNGTTWTAWGAFATTTSLTLPSGDGLKTVSVRFMNSSGTVLGTYQTTITLDTMAPANGTLTITPAVKAFTLKWQGFSDAGSGIASYRLVMGTQIYPSCTATPLYAGPNTSYVQGGVVSGTTYYYLVCALDNAGNISSGATAKMKAP